RRAQQVRDAVQQARQDDPAPEQRRPLGRADAWAQALLGDHAGAIASARSWLGLQDREGAELLVRLAVLAVRREDLPSASQALTLARRSMPQDPQVLRDLAAVEVARGRGGAAVALLQQRLALAPDDDAARIDLAGALAAAGRLEDAAAAWRELAAAARARGEEALARSHELRGAELLLEAGHPRAALTVAEALGGDDPDGHAALVAGLALAALRRPAEARAALRDALLRRPGDLRAEQALAALER
ncbi:MAG: hypothetical protein AAGH15_28970, partial [Myxococcota bacterium]